MPSPESAPLRTVVIGAGYFGRLHAAKYAAMPGVDLLAVVDVDSARACAVAAEFGTRGASDYRAFLGVADAVSIVTPCVTHYAIASDFLRHGSHVLLEKPMTATLEEADELIRIAGEGGRILQVGHQERIFVTGLDLDNRLAGPLDIHCRRFSRFSGRGVDCSVVMDLMIHDIDFVQNLVRDPVVDMILLTSGPHEAAVRLDFADGSVARLEAGRNGAHRHRSARLRDQAATIEIDFLDRRCHHSESGVIKSTPCPGINGHAHAAGFLEADDLGHAIAAFVHSIRTGRPAVVPAEAGRRALATALRIDAARVSDSVAATAG